MSNYSGFIFNEIGELIESPTNVTLEQLYIVHGVLIKAREYIKASRVNHLIIIEELI